MKKTSLIISALFLLAGGCSNKTQDTTHSTFVAEAEVEKMFVNGCVDSALKTSGGKFTHSTITQMCLCSLSKIRQQYSVAQLEEMDKASKTEQLAFTQLALRSGIECGKNLSP